MRRKEKVITDRLSNILTLKEQQERLKKNIILLIYSPYRTNHEKAILIAGPVLADAHLL